MSFEKIRYFAPSREEADAFPLPGDDSYVIIPAKNEQDMIGLVLMELLQGIDANRIIVVDNSTDKTARIAEEMGVVVVRKRHQLSRLRLDRLSQCFGLEFDSTQVCVGKGAAFLASILYLESIRAPEHARLFFLDADLRNLNEVNPLRYLNLADCKSGGNLACVKLAHHNRENELLLAFWNGARGQTSRYASMNQLIWPLCGQAVVRFGTLKQLTLATGYSVETVMLMSLLDRFGPEALGQVRIAVNLLDRPDSASKVMEMFCRIMDTAEVVLASGVPLHKLGHKAFRDLNRELRPREILFTTEDGPNCTKTVLPEKFIPPFQRLWEAGVVS